MTDLILPPWQCALVQAGRIRAVPIDAERCPTCEGDGRIPVSSRGSDGWDPCEDCRAGLVAPQPGHWTLTTNDEPAPVKRFGPDDSLAATFGCLSERVPGSDTFVRLADLPAPGQEVGPVTVTAVIPILDCSTPAGRSAHVLRLDDSLHLYLPSEGFSTSASGAARHFEFAHTDLSDHLLPGLDWTRPYAALIGATDG